MRDSSTRLMDGQNKMWTGAYLCGRVNIFFFKFLCITDSRTAQSALHVMLLSYYIGIYVYFMSVNATFAVAAHTRKVSRKPSTCPTKGNIFIMHKTLRRNPSVT